MIKKFRAGGIIYNIGHKILIEILSEKFGEIKSKPRVFGYDIECKDEKMLFFIQTTDEKEYFLHIDFTGEFSEINSFMIEISNMFFEKNILYDIGFYEQDLIGNQISEDFNFIHPARQNV